MRVSIIFTIHFGVPRFLETSICSAQKANNLSFEESMIDSEYSDEVLLGGQFYSASPPTFQCKPNHDLVVGFDDGIPYDRTFRNGEHLSGRTIPAPRWDEEPILRIAATSNAVRRDNSDHLMVHLRTWLLHRTDLYPRCREITA